MHMNASHIDNRGAGQQEAIEAGNQFGQWFFH